MSDTTWRIVLSNGVIVEAYWVERDRVGDPPRAGRYECVGADSDACRSPVECVAHIALRVSHLCQQLCVHAWVEQIVAPGRQTSEERLDAVLARLALARPSPTDDEVKVPKELGRRWSARKREEP